MLYCGPLNNVRFKESLLFEFTGILPDWLVETGEESFFRFPFEYNHHVYDDDGSPFFGKQLYHINYGVDSNAPPFVFILTKLLENELIKKIDINAKYEDLIRIIVNGQTSVNRPPAHMDDDISSDIWTMLYYVTDCSGDTIFFDTQKNMKVVHKVKYKKGKIVIFPSSFMHQALPPKNGWRVSIGMMFKMKSSLNKHIFSI